MNPFDQLKTYRTKSVKLMIETMKPLWVLHLLMLGRLFYQNVCLFVLVLICSLFTCSAQDVFVNARYNCRLMTGYGGNAYNQCYAGLVQPRWVDLDGDLIKPWEFHDKVRPGTLIVANISLQVFVIPQSNGPYKTKKVRPSVLFCLIDIHTLCRSIMQSSICSV